MSKYVKSTTLGNLLLFIRGNKNFFVVSAIVALIISIFLYVSIFGVNVLYLDEWSFASLVKKYQTEGISFSFLFKQHNEHRIFFPKLLYIAVLPVSQMNSKMLMFFNAFLVLIEFFCFFWMAKKQFNISLSNIPFWIIIIPLFVFNFRQWQNLLWAFQVAFYMVLIFAIISLFFIDKCWSSVTKHLRFLYFVLAILSAVIATFSSAMGFLVWIAGAIQIFIRNSDKPKYKNWIFVLIWIVFAVSAFYFYNKGLNSNIFQDIQYALTHPFSFFHFFFSFISLTSVHSLSIIAFPIGVILFFISIFVLYKTYKNKRLNENSFWIAVYTFSLLFSLLTTLGRCPVSFEYTDRSRYTIFTVLLIISTFMMFYDNYRIAVNSNEKKLFRFFFWGIFVLAVELNAIGLMFGIKEKKEREKIKEIVLNYKTVPLDRLKETEPWLDDSFICMIKELAPFVEENHYNVFEKKKGL
jgi:ABC-2 type transport system permease protein